MSDAAPPRSELILYQTEDGRTRVECRFEEDTLWLTQGQMAELFQTTPQNITLHLKEIFGEGELVEEATCKEFLQVRREGQRGHTRRPDVVVFVNGLPLAVIELKSATAENATIWSAFQQLQTYKRELPALFVFNEILIVSDGLEARIGTVSSNRERFLPWRTIEG